MWAGGLTRRAKSPAENGFDQHTKWLTPSDPSGYISNKIMGIIRLIGLTNRKGQCKGLNPQSNVTRKNGSLSLGKIVLIICGLKRAVSIFLT